MYQQQHHHHHDSAGAGNGSNISVPDRRIAGPVVVIVVLAAMFLSASGAEDFSPGYVVFNACLAGTLIALTIAGSVVSALRRPHRIRRAEEKARAETALAYTGRVESNTSMVGATTPNVVAFAVTIRCGDGNLVKVMLPYVTGSGKFQVGHQVIKRSGERWPVDVNPESTRPSPARRAPARRLGPGRPGWALATTNAAGLAGAVVLVGLYVATRRAHLAGLRDRAQRLERERGARST